MRSEISRAFVHHLVPIVAVRKPGGYILADNSLARPHQARRFSANNSASPDGEHNFTSGN
jgi:hypothetical protein